MTYLSCLSQVDIVESPIICFGIVTSILHCLVPYKTSWFLRGPSALLSTEKFKKRLPAVEAETLKKPLAIP